MFYKMTYLIRLHLEARREEGVREESKERCPEQAYLKEKLFEGV